jgi:type I restriction enzyme S subunit
MGSDWATEKLEDVLSALIDHRGKTPKKLGGDFVEEGIRVVSAKNIKSRRLDLSINPRYVTEDMWNSWMPVKLETGDVLLTSEAPLGEVAFLVDEHRFCLGQRLFALRPDADKLDSRFLFYSLQSPQLRNRLLGRASGTTVQGIRQAELRKVQIELPPVEEQRRIAGVLAALDDKIRFELVLAELLGAKISNVFDVFTTDARRGVMTTLGEICEFRYGKALPAAKRRTGEVAVVGSSGIVGSHDEYLFEGPVIVVGRKGTAGSVTWVSRNTFPIDTTFVALPKEGIGKLFLFEQLKRADLPHLTSDSAVPGLNRDAAYSRPVISATAEVISEFEIQAKPLRERRDASESLVVVLEGLRNELLPQLVSGRVIVPDSYDPIDVLGPRLPGSESASNEPATIEEAGV